jgi:hypothetical protein
MLFFTSYNRKESILYWSILHNEQHISNFCTGQGIGGMELKYMNGSRKEIEIEKDKPVDSLDTRLQEGRICKT